MPVIERMPDSGRVVVAHPSVRLFAGIYAEREGLDLFLTDMAGPTHVYILDVDAMLNVPTGWRPADAC
jgi:hypothetical protein